MQFLQSQITDRLICADICQKTELSVMKKLSIVIPLLLLFVSSHSMSPDEGIWIPLLIEKYNIKLMQEKGFKLSAEDIYSVNRACMKDAVVRFDGGCTAGFISGEGLLITNHHCGYDRIQEHSNLDHDFLSNGFWAKSRSEELLNPGLKVTLLKRMEDVTDNVLNGVTEEMAGGERDKLISGNIAAIQAKANEGNDYEVVVRPFFMGNQYFLFVSEVFTDVRLVGAPPSSIGKFGGDTDNWIWPRHTGDFSLFRVYSDKNNKPSGYSPDNIPYKPEFFFTVSLEGFREGDFTMVIGYPGSTVEYVSSAHLDMIKNFVDPALISVRTKKIEIIDEAMKSDPLIRIQYSAKKAGLSNSWKKWMGEIQGLDRMNTIGKETDFENRISEWIDSDSTRKSNYGYLLPSLKEVYQQLKEYTMVNSITSEVINGVETMALARSLKGLSDMYGNESNEEDIQKAKIILLQEAGSFFRDYNRETDKKLFTALLSFYGQILDEKWQAPAYRSLKKSCNGDFSKIAGKLFGKTPFSNAADYKALVTGFNKSTIKKLEKDQFYSISSDASKLIADKVRPELVRLNSTLQQLNRIYMKAQMEYQKDKVLYPDANSTLRIAYGTIRGYSPADGICFKHFTTLKGIIEKDNPEIYDYKVAEKLRELYEAKDFGPYGKDGEMHVCFIADNHTTGGNSGSPVLNSTGHLIGVNFDRAWEGVASDMAFNPDQSRNISLDIRYALFIIDKFAGAGYLLKEMTIVE